MNTKPNEFIKYIGIDPSPKLNTPYFKQLLCNGQFQLSNNVPDVEDLMNVTAQATITSSQLIHDSGHCLALLNGSIRFSFQYATPDPRYALYSSEHSLYFGEYLTLPDHISRTIHLFPSVVILDLFSYNLSPRALYHNAIILLMVQLG